MIQGILPINLTQFAKGTMKFMLFNRYFQVSWVGLVVYLILVTLLCSLGFWQLSRAEEKKQILVQQEQALDVASINLNQKAIPSVEKVRYQKVSATGHYDNAHQFLLDNQIVDGKNGYFVMTPLFVDGQSRAVLVNRGWVALGNDRNTLPQVDIQNLQAEITGRINQFPSVGIKLKGAEIPTETWPSVVQVIDSQVLSAKLGAELVNYQIELDPSVAEGYKRQWKMNTPILPEKHLAYAVQWFSLALTLTALFIWISIKKRSEYTA